MTKPAFPFWARAEAAGQIVTPPDAKIDQGHNAGEPTAAGYQNWHQNKTGLWVRGLQHNYADIVVGSAAQVTAEEATHDVSTFVAAITAGDLISFIGGQTHTLVRTEDITEADVKLVFERTAILAASTFTLTLSGDRCRVIDGQFSGFGANDLILSGASGLLIGTGLDHDAIDLAGNLWSILVDGMNHSSRQFVEVLSDAAHTLTIKDIGKKLVITPTATRIQTLPTTSIQAGDIIEIHNLAASESVTIESSDGDDIATWQNGSIKIIALQDTPTDQTHWSIAEALGGASPKFWVHRNGVDQSSIGVTAEIIRWTVADINIGNSFAVDADDSGGAGESRWTPGVPGTYVVGGIINSFSFGTGRDGFLEHRVDGTDAYTHSWSQDSADRPASSGMINFMFEVTVLTYFELWLKYDASLGGIEGDKTISFFWGYRLP